MKPRSNPLSLLAGLILGATGVCGAAAPAVAVDPAGQASLPEKISFNEHIQPILSEYCYHCHGPDSGTREPKSEPLRLDRVEDAFAIREDGLPVIIKKNPAESAIIQRILSTDPEEIMPPPRSHKTVKPEELAMLSRWIEQGAEYEAHWSFAPVTKPALPTAGENWAANPIDRFIAEKHQSEKVVPNPPEEPARFYRRLHFDLTGLPPAPTAIEAFVKSYTIDPKTATHTAADQLLATPASAEHLTKHWLDAARYADTHGIHIDNYRAIWPYRDWVIGAFQANMPWDQFTTEQIAGDLLPNRSLDQLVATGFSRCVATSGEGGAIPEEYDAIYAKDRVETVSAIWLGLTTGCAACHDHKFDPVSTKEFYSLTAFFRNTTMSALDGNAANHPPNVFVPLQQDREELAALDAGVKKTEQQIADRAIAAKPKFETWLAGLNTSAIRRPDPALDIHLPLAETQGPLHGTVGSRSRTWPAEPSRIAGPLGPAPVISDKPIELGDLGSFSRKDQATYGGYIYVEGTPNGAIIARMDASSAYRGWDIFLDNGKVAAHVIDTWPTTATKITTDTPLKSGEWHHVMVTFDGSAASENVLTIYVNGRKSAASAVPSAVGKDIETKVQLQLGTRHGGDSKLNGKVAMQDFRFYKRLLSVSEITEVAGNSLLQHILSLPVAKRTAEQQDSVFKHYLRNLDLPSRDLETRLLAMKAKHSSVLNRGSTSLVMDDKPEPAFAHVLTRGAYADKGERVTPTTPAVLPPMAADAPKNRLGLARWLNDPANPLPARVTMNRTWSYFFGSGIVESNSDFGIMGSRPSHPKLLDWLAAEFVSSQWNYRHMLKLMVTSAAYRQSGTVSPEKLEKDPANRLLARGPRYRLDAEQIRDLALSTAGLLRPTVGGPSVKPYQPEGIWEAVAMTQSDTRHYRADEGDGLYRRSLYTLWKRTAAPASLEIFNAPTREVFCVQRDKTNTPLQALVLLNDPQFIEASRELASHALKNEQDFDARLDFITERLDGRKFDPEEREIVKKSLDSALVNFRNSEQDAKQLIETGATPPRKDANVPELAAWTLLASQILNLDETITR